MNAIKDWTFLQEPLYRWALMVGALILILAGWYGIIKIAKG